MPAILWTEVGAELTGVAQSLITTCRLHDINPYDYLVDVQTLTTQISIVCKIGC
ncbi:MAG: transposase domain-containing protein [Ferrovum myxofaciens]|nr:transposase domain-containing protein [Ferrovum myxofaciens]QKE41696.1 MAG: transposase domain-containing protein [Ferrovum myxofaciens]